MEIAERLGREILWANAATMNGWHLCSAGQPAEGHGDARAGYEIADGLEHTRHAPSSRRGCAASLNTS